MTQLEIRRTALSPLNASKERRDRLGDNRHSTTQRIAESLKRPFQPGNKRAGPSAEGREDSSPKRLRTGPIGDDVFVIEDDEKTLDVKKVLKIFRIDQKKLALVSITCNVSVGLTHKGVGEIRNIRCCGALWRIR